MSDQKKHIEKAPKLSEQEQQEIADDLRRHIDEIMRTSKANNPDESALVHVAIACSDACFLEGVIAQQYVGGLTEENAGVILRTVEQVVRETLLHHIKAIGADFGATNITVKTSPDR